MDRIDGLQSVDSAIGNLEAAPVSIRRWRVMFGQIGFLEPTERRQRDIGRLRLSRMARSATMAGQRSITGKYRLSRIGDV